MTFNQYKCDFCKLIFLLKYKSYTAERCPKCGSTDFIQSESVIDVKLSNDFVRGKWK